MAGHPGGRWISGAYRTHSGSAPGRQRLAGRRPARQQLAAHSHPALGSREPPVPRPWGRGSRPSRGPGAAGAAHPSSFLPGVPSPALQQPDQPDRAPQVRVSPAERRQVHGRLHPLTGDGLRPGELPEPVGPVDPPEPGLAHPAERSPAGRAARRPLPRPARAGYRRRGGRVQRAERLPGGRRSGPGFLCLGCCHGRRHPRLLAACAH